MHCWGRGQSSLSTREMKSLSILFLSSATVAVVRSNPCQNNEDVFFPDPEGYKQNCVDSVSRENLFFQIVIGSTSVWMGQWWAT